MSQNKEINTGKVAIPKILRMGSESEMMNWIASMTSGAVKYIGA